MRKQDTIYHCFKTIIFKGNFRVFLKRCENFVFNPVATLFTTPQHIPQVFRILGISSKLLPTKRERKVYEHFFLYTIHIWCLELSEHFASVVKPQIQMVRRILRLLPYCKIGVGTCPKKVQWPNRG